MTEALHDLSLVYHERDDENYCMFFEKSVVYIEDKRWTSYNMDEIVRHFSAYIPVQRVPKRTILLTEGNALQKVFVVASGCIKMYRLDQCGEEQVVGYKTNGDVFPESYAFGQTTHALFYYEAIEDTKLLAIEKPQFLTDMADYPELRNACFAYVVKSNISLTVQVTALVQSHAVDKLSMMLYHLMLRYGVEKAENEYWIKLHMRHSTLARLTGLSRETVTSELVKLRRNGIIDYDTKKIVIYSKALCEKIGEDQLVDD